MLDVSCIIIAVVFALEPHREMKSIDSKDKVCLSGELSSIDSR